GLCSGGRGEGAAWSGGRGDSGPRAWVGPCRSGRKSPDTIACRLSGDFFIGVRVRPTGTCTDEVSRQRPPDLSGDFLAAGRLPVRTSPSRQGRPLPAVRTH